MAHCYKLLLILLIVGCETSQPTASKSQKSLAAPAVSRPIDPMAAGLVSAIEQDDEAALRTMFVADAGVDASRARSFIRSTIEAFGTLTLTGLEGRYDGWYVSRSVGYDHPGGIFTFEYELKSSKLKDCVLVIQVPANSSLVSRLIVAGRPRG